MMNYLHSLEQLKDLELKRLKSYRVIRRWGPNLPGSPQSRDGNGFVLEGSYTYLSLHHLFNID